MNRLYGRAVATEGGKTKVGSWHVIEWNRTLCSVDIRPKDTGLRTTRSEVTPHEPNPVDRRCGTCEAAIARRRLPGYKPPRHDR